MKIQNIGQVTIESVNALVVNRVPEQKTIDYKLKLDIAKASDKKEFLADISSFANADGGTLFFGIGETKGIPETADGFECDDADALILRAESSMRDGIQPRIRGVHSKALTVSAGKIILIIQVPSSIEGPHQVSFDGSSKYYTRNSNGKYQMDQAEIAAAYRENSQLKTRISDLQHERLTAILKNETPAELLPNPKVIFHLIPEESIKHNPAFDLGDHQFRARDLAPLGGGNWNNQFNFEGLLNMSRPPGRDRDSAYLQIYKNGMIETVNALMISSFDQVKAMTIEGYIMREAKRYLDFFKGLGLDSPVHAFLSISGAKGMSINSENAGHLLRPQALNRDPLTLPEIILEPDADCKRAFLGWFNLIWNSFGYPRSYNFTDGGEWKFNYNFF